jgi:hypothetical protein
VPTSHATTPSAGVPRDVVRRLDCNYSEGGIRRTLFKEKKEAIGKNTKWNGKLYEPPPMPLIAGACCCRVSILSLLGCSSC